MVILLVFCVSFTIVGIIINQRGIQFTEDIRNYNSEIYPIPKTLFPSEIPENAQVISFSYFNYWHEVEDIYLELKFNTLEEMETYLSNIKLTCKAYCQNKNYPKNSGEFIETQNIYNQSYEEMFCTLYWSSGGEKDYTGYNIVKGESGEIRYECNFGIISYSFDELVVIHTCVYGWYRSNVHKHIPEYFKRFCVPLQENHERILYLEW